MNTFSIKEAIKGGWELFKKDWKNLALIALVFMLLTNLQNSDRITSEFSTVLTVILGILFFLLSTLVQIGWTKTLLKVLDGGRAEMRDLFAYRSLFFKYLGTIVIYMAVAGAVALIGAGATLLAFMVSPYLAGAVGVVAAVATIFVLIRYSFTHALVIDRSEISIGKAFGVSAHMTEGVKWKLVGFAIVVALINILGFLALLVGLLATVPVSALAWLSIYRKLYRPESAQQSPISA